MKELYADERFASPGSAVRRDIMAAAGVFAASLAICMAVCFFVDETNATRLMLLNILISGTGGCVALYWLFDRILPSVARQKYLAHLLSAARTTVEGYVEDTGRDATVARYISARELRLTDQKERVSLLYWDLAVPLPALGGQYVTFRTVQNRIVAYEVTQ